MVLTGHRVEGGYRNTIPTPSGIPIPGPLGYYLPRGGSNILDPGIYEYRAVFLYTGIDAWSRMMRTEEEILFKQVFLTEFFHYSPIVQYDLEGLSVYCIV
jgi:hypothetical protein